MRPGHLLRNLVRSLILLVACVSVCSIGWSADDSLRVALQSRYADLKAAMAAHDGAAIAAILAPDFVSVDVSGKSEFASQMIAEVNGLKPDSNKSSETTLISVTPGTGVVTVKQRYDMKTVRAGADGTQHNVELIALSTNSWVKPAGVWLIERTVTNELSYIRDGLLVAHKVQPQGDL